MLGQRSRHDTIKRYVTAFGLLFNDIEIERESADGEKNIIKVPLSYGPREKLEAAAEREFGSERMSIATVLPRMSFNLSTIYYDAERKTNTRSKFVFNDNHTMLNSVPWNFKFELTILIKNIDEGNQIVEQILPWFSPDITLSVIPIASKPEFTRDIQITLSESSTADEYQGDLTTRRTLTWTLVFVMKAFFFSPINTGASVIKQIILNFDSPADGSVIVQPGLTANGQATSNLSLSVPYQNINSDDPFGYITDFISE